MAKQKVVGKSTNESREIKTSLYNKEEIFKMLALAESSSLPCLLIGEPGTGKTKAVLEYAKAWLNRDGQMTAEDFANKIYILETDEGTKISEVKGMPDLSVLFTENKYELNAPITNAEIIIINEVDKASAGIRNAMLGIMNEKFLFNGKCKIPCKWKLFIATCNTIPKDEMKNAFWDRFMLKMEVDRISSGELMKYYEKGGKDYVAKFVLNIPNKEEVASVSLSNAKMEKYLQVGYDGSSDRTLTFVPYLTKAISYIWDVSIDKALVKTAQVMLTQAAASSLQQLLVSPELKIIMSKVELLRSYSGDSLKNAIDEIEIMIKTYAINGKLNEEDVAEIESSMKYILQGADISSIEEVIELV